MTISHVAAHAGVSRAAVYAVLNKNKDMNIGVSELTRKKVQKAINELGYIPNESARTLVSGRSHNVGMILQDSDTEFALRLSAGVDELFLENGFMIINAYSANDSERERQLLKSFLSRNVDGLIIARLNPKVNSDILSQYEDYEVPVIHVARDIAFNETRVMELAVEHAVSLGATRIGYLGYAGCHQFSGSERLSFLKAAIGARKGIALTLTGEVANYDECMTLARKLKKSAKAPEVVICYNDRLADLLVHCLRTAGLEVPQQIGVIGIDGYRDPFQPANLTTVRLPVGKMAAELWNTFNNIENTQLPVLIEPELIVGDSTCQMRN